MFRKSCKESATAGPSTGTVTGVTPSFVYSEVEEEEEEKGGDHDSGDVTDQVKSDEVRKEA